MGGDAMVNSQLNESNSTESASQSHRGTGSVTPPPKSDVYSQEDSDGIGEVPNGYLDPIKNATGALLGGISNSSGRSGESTGISIGAVSANRKGHPVQSERALWKRLHLYAAGSMRTANSYMTTLARQQRDRARELSVSRLEVGGLATDSIGSEGSISQSTSVGNGMSNLGGVQAEDVDIMRMEAGAGITDRGDKVVLSGRRPVAVSGTTVEKARLSSSDSNSTRSGKDAATPLRRGGRMTVTTGDLVKLFREEKRECTDRDGPYSERAKRGRPHQTTTAGGVDWIPLSNGGDISHAQRGLRSGEKPNRMIRRRSEGTNLAHLQPDVRTGGERSFRVLGLEIGHVPESQQFLVCAGGVFAFLLVYGYMQERLVVQIFDRKLGLFLTLLQFFGYASYAFLQRMLHHHRERKIPLTYYVFLGLLQALMQALTNISMMYLNYPAKVLFKSSRMVPIMCFGVCWQGRKYSWKDYIVVFLIVAGLVTFISADARAAEDSEAPNNLVGVLLISMALIIDAALINIQEEIMNKYDSSQDELIMFSYLSGTVFVALACLYTGDLVQGARFIHDQGLGCVFAVMLFAGAGFLGVSCVAALTKRFGALVSAITTTARKALTLLLSFVLFPDKPISTQHYLGSMLFIFGLVVKSTGKKSKPNVPASGRQSGSLAETPLTFQARGRKRLPSQESDQLETGSSAVPLLSDVGSGGASSSGGGAGTNGSGGDADQAHSHGLLCTGDGEPAVTSNSGGYPVRHRGIPKNSGNGVAGANGGGGASTLGNGVGIANPGMNGSAGYWHARPIVTEAPQDLTGSRSPTRRRILPGSPPVTGLGMRL